MKKLLIMVIGVALAFSLVACGENTVKTSNEFVEDIIVETIIFEDVIEETYIYETVIEETYIR